MYLSPAPLDKVKHAGLSFTASTNFSYAANLTMAPLSAQETPEAGNNYPIIFLPADQDSVLPHALLGLSGKNVFVDAAGAWKANYIPAVVRKYPFGLVRADDNSDVIKMIVAIDEQAENFKAKTGRPLFEADGSLTELVKSASDFAAAHQRQMMATTEALKELETTGVLIDRSISVPYINAEGKEVVRKINGLRVVDREKMLALPNEILLKWLKNGVMEVIYAHWHSLSNMYNIVVASS